MTCKAILIVEDDDDIRKQVCMALEAEGYETLAAENGRKALDLLNSLTDDKVPGCIILDLMMPEMDGNTFLATLERDHKEKFGSIKVLIATAKGSPINPEMIPRTLERIQKPFDLDELYRVVALHCG